VTDGVEPAAAAASGGQDAATARKSGSGSLAAAFMQVCWVGSGRRPRFRALCRFVASHTLLAYWDQAVAQLAWMVMTTGTSRVGLSTLQHGVIE
jgi:hypothetical protein